MMRSFLISFLLAFLTSTVCAQVPSRVALEAAADRAYKNSEFGVAADGYRSALAIARDSADIAAQGDILAKLIRCYLDLNDSRSMLDAISERYRVARLDTGRSPLDLTLILSGAPVLMARMNDRPGALRALELLDTAARAVGDPVGMVVYYQMRALTFNRFHDYDETLRSALAAADALRSTTHPLAAKLGENIDDNLANAYYHTGRYEEALNIFRRISDRYAAGIDRLNLRYPESLTWQANCEACLGRFEEGQRHYVEAWSIVRDKMMKDLLMQSAGRRGRMWNDINRYVWNMLPYGFSSAARSNDFTEAAYNALILGKGLMLASDISVRDIAATDPRLRSLYDRAADARSRLEEHRKDRNIEAAMPAYLLADSLETELFNALRERGDALPVPDVTAPDIARALAPGEAIIDFAECGSEKGLGAYFGCFLRYGMERPEILRIGQPEVIDSLFGAYEPQPAAIYDDTADAATVRAWLLDSITPRLDGIHTLYFVPSGLINRLAVEAMLLPDSIDAVRLTSSRRLLTMKNSQERKPASATLYGGLNYDVSPDVMADNARLNPLVNTFADSRRTDALRGDTLFLPLRYSDYETDSIGRLLRSNGVDVTELKADMGTEESFFALSGHSPDLLQLSTHGFYFSPDNVPSWSSLNGYDDSMYLTGLVLSGGNAEWMGRELPAGVCGGLLTSSDIAALDLSGTGLVVLSACETALGQASNEGVFGLQRAFKKAGAGSIVMSLWPVSDRVTMEFMVSFYEALVNCGWNKRRAFASARDRIRAAYPNHYYWAGFVMAD